MKGDYHRYLSELGDSYESESMWIVLYFVFDWDEYLEEKAGEAYKLAYEKAEKELATTHPIRLGLALNYSVYFYEIKNEADKACELAKKVSCFSIINGDFNLVLF